MPAECRILTVESGGASLVQCEIAYQRFTANPQCGRCALTGAEIAVILQERLDNDGKANTGATYPFCAATVDRPKPPEQNPHPDAMTVIYANEH